MKNWFIKYFITILILLSITAGTNVIIDPFFHYHKPIEGLYQYYNREPYQNPGVIKHFDYDTAILGSCMAENFKPSLFEELMGGTVIKAPHQAASTYNLFQYASMVSERNDVKKIYWGVDVWTLELDPNYAHDPIPDYLIDHNPFTDIEYLLNRDVFESYNSIILGHTFYKTKSGTMDSAWRWADITVFSQKAALETKSDPSAFGSLTPEQRNRNFQENMYHRILYLVKNNPDIDFVFYYPPYSIRFWKQMLDNDIFYERIEYIRTLTEELLKYPNTEVFNFQGEEDIITNLYLYKDMVHYSDKVNDYMTECFANGKCRVTLENWENQLSSFINFVETFDCSIFETEITTCMNLKEYVHKNSNDYVWIISLKQTGNRDEGQLSDILNTLHLKAPQETSAHAYWILDGGREINFCEADDSICTDILYENLQIGINTELFPEIVINDISYSAKQNGINLVVWDKNNCRVIDSININDVSGELVHF